jgi:hypothetical protein
MIFFFPIFSCRFGFIVVCGELLKKMEHGSHSDNSKSTFSLVDEDHTLANAVRFTLNQESVLSLSDSSIQKNICFSLLCSNFV